ncbi:30S ribosome-binding factor RbfA [Weeksellaceae bacterium KMM 9713]|uniref:Ribosome-binding factor A n=1 Tax=Profundicola chukchiensis TaxID=2961959 RepID=A0A9X4N171_9FLAO|nr:30S ribosome-binding factor RbfA [Profundicola chukchiensis]MDG4946676.1 30S ribosome-binding factor RbfA [Profundicola chukchiensis]
MESNRLNKVNQLIQKDMADIFRKLTSKIGRNMLITVTEVRTTSDLSISKVYLSIFPTNNTDKVMDFVKENHAFIRGELGNRIGKQMRIVPELQFFVDVTLDKADEIDRALKGKGDNPVL